MPAETLHYKGTVMDKDTGKPIAGATVVVRRMISRDALSENRVLQETRHTTGADGTYSFRSRRSSLPRPTSTSSWTWSTPITPPGTGSATP